MVRVMICLLFLGSVYGLSVHSTDNDGLGKWERINLNEKRLQEMAKELSELKQEVKRLKDQLSQLREKLRKLDK